MSYREIFVPGQDGSRVSAVQLGPLVYAQGLLPLTPPGAGLRAQLESVLDQVRSVIGEAAARPMTSGASRCSCERSITGAC